MSRLLVVSDLDGTLLGDDDALGAFQKWYASRSSLLALAYSSGRSFSSILESMRKFELPAPAAIISEVGTQIHTFPSGEPLSNWPASRFWSADVVKEVLKCLPKATPQLEEFQTRFKVSYFLHNAAERDLNQIHQSLKARSIEAEIIYSSDRDLDILPGGVNKGFAAIHLAEKLGFRANRTIVCGDSGNDASMMNPRCWGVIVANAQRELKSLTGEHLYHARASFAAGVVEGIEHWIGHLSRSAIPADPPWSTPGEDHGKPG